jgi:hypothetical protein
MYIALGLLLRVILLIKEILSSIYEKQLRLEDANLSPISPSRHFVADTPSRLHPMRYAVQAPPLSIYP